MAAVSDAIYALAYAGVGSGLGAVVAAVIASRAGRGAARAQAADLLTEAAERVSHMNETLDKENRRVRRHLDDLVDAVEGFLGGEIDTEQLHQAVLRAKE